MWMAENHHGSESKCISRRKDHAGNEWTASQSAAKKNRTHGQQQQQQQQQQREQQPAPVIDLRVAHASQGGDRPLLGPKTWGQKRGGEGGGEKKKEKEGEKEKGKRGEKGGGDF